MDEYINTAVPVSSKSIAEKHLTDVSSATVRNELASLEELGYLTQFHTSGGRVPSPQAYRFYIEELMQTAEGRLFELSKTNMKKDFTQINPVINEAYELLQKAAARTDGLSGLQTGFHDIDKITSGWQNSDLIIIAARPAMGKTAFVLSMAKNMAVNYNTPVAIFSLEMSNIQLVNRLIINTCDIPGDKIKAAIRSFRRRLPAGGNVQESSRSVRDACRCRRSCWWRRCSRLRACRGAARTRRRRAPLR